MRAGYDQRPTLNIGGIANSSITVSSPITGTGHYGVLGLSSNGAVIDGTASEQTDLTAPEISLFTASGIGASDDLDIAAERSWRFFNTLGAVNISNAGPLTLEFSQNTGTTTTISTTSPLTVSSVSSAGDLTLSGRRLGGERRRSRGPRAARRNDCRQRDPVEASDDSSCSTHSRTSCAAGNISITWMPECRSGVGGNADIPNGTVSADNIGLIGQGDSDTLLGGAAGKTLRRRRRRSDRRGRREAARSTAELAATTPRLFGGSGGGLVGVATGGSNGYRRDRRLVGIESATGSRSPTR